MGCGGSVGPKSERDEDNGPPAPSMLTPPRWEPAWCPKTKRWYFQDRVSGKSTWDRPDGFDGRISEEPPPRPSEACGHSPRDIPSGWEASFDTVHGRMYYFNRETRTSTWTHPREVPPLRSEVATEAEVDVLRREHQRLTREALDGLRQENKKLRSEQTVLQTCQAELAEFKAVNETLRTDGDQLRVGFQRCELESRLELVTRQEQQEQALASLRRSFDLECEEHRRLEKRRDARREAAIAGARSNLDADFFENQKMEMRNVELASFRQDAARVGALERELADVRSVLSSLRSTNSGLEVQCVELDAFRRENLRLDPLQAELSELRSSLQVEREKNRCLVNEGAMFENLRRENARLEVQDKEIASLQNAFTMLRCQASQLELQNMELRSSGVPREAPQVSGSQLELHDEEIMALREQVVRQRNQEGEFAESMHSALVVLRESRNVEQCVARQHGDQLAATTAELLEFRERLGQQELQEGKFAARMQSALANLREEGRSLETEAIRTRQRDVEALAGEMWVAREELAFQKSEEAAVAERAQRSLAGLREDNRRLEGEVLNLKNQQLELRLEEVMQRREEVAQRAKANEVTAEGGQDHLPLSTLSALREEGLCLEQEALRGKSEQIELQAQQVKDLQDRLSRQVLHEGEFAERMRAAVAAAREESRVQEQASLRHQSETLDFQLAKITSLQEALTRQELQEQDVAGLLTAAQTQSRCRQIEEEHHWRARGEHLEQRQSEIRQLQEGITLQELQEETFAARMCAALAAQREENLWLEAQVARGHSDAAELQNAVARELHDHSFQHEEWRRSEVAEMHAAFSALHEEGRCLERWKGELQAFGFDHHLARVELMELCRSCASRCSDVETAAAGYGRQVEIKDGELEETRAALAELQAKHSDLLSRTESTSTASEKQCRLWIELPELEEALEGLRRENEAIRGGGGAVLGGNDVGACRPFGKTAVAGLLRDDYICSCGDHQLGENKATNHGDGARMCWRKEIEEVRRKISALHIENVQLQSKHGGALHVSAATATHQTDRGDATKEVKEDVRAPIQQGLKYEPEEHRLEGKSFGQSATSSKPSDLDEPATGQSTEKLGELPVATTKQVVVPKDGLVNDPSIASMINAKSRDASVPTRTDEVAATPRNSTTELKEVDCQSAVSSMGLSDGLSDLLNETSDGKEETLAGEASGLSQQRLHCLALESPTILSVPSETRTASSCVTAVRAAAEAECVTTTVSAEEECEIVLRKLRLENTDSAKMASTPSHAVQSHPQRAHVQQQPRQRPLRWRQAPPLPEPPRDDDCESAVHEQIGIRGASRNDVFTSTASPPLSSSKDGVVKRTHRTLPLDKPSRETFRNSSRKEATPATRGWARSCPRLSFGKIQSDSWAALRRSPEGAIVLEGPAGNVEDMAAARCLPPGLPLTLQQMKEDFNSTSSGLPGVFLPMPWTDESLSRRRVSA